MTESGSSNSLVKQYLAVSAAGLLSFIALNNMFGGSKFRVEGRTVLLTGASQGMGRSLARVLSSKGADVVLVARNKERLAEARKHAEAAAKSPGTQRFHTISADVTSAEANEELLAEVTRWNSGNPPDIVWANAGQAMPKLLLDSSEDDLRSQMEINYFAAVFLARSTLTAWLNRPQSKQPEGEKKLLPRHLIMTSSVAAFLGMVSYAPYSPAKAALRNFHDVLRQELNLYNATLGPTEPEMFVHTVFPGTILSPGLDKENETKHPALKVLEEDDIQQTPDQVAEAAVRELEKGRRLITTQILAAAMRASALQGSLRDRLFVDTIFSWVVALVYLFVGPDMIRKIRKWAKTNGRPQHSAVA